MPGLVRRDKLLQALHEHEMTLIWGVVGERNCFDHDVIHNHVADALVTFSGVYYLDGRDVIKGGLTMRNILEIDRHHRPYPQRMELLPFGTNLPRNKR